MNQTFSQKLLTLVAAVLLSFGAMAQEVQWSHQVEFSPDIGEAVLTLTATMEPGWHLYDMDVPQDGPQATVFSFSQSEGVEPKGDIVPSRESVKNEDATYGIVIGAWEDTVTFTQRFTLTGTPDTKGVIKGKVTFMACDDRNCMPPQSYTFSCNVSGDHCREASENPSQTTSQVDALKSITADDLETCCCIGWNGKK